MPSFISVSREGRRPLREYNDCNLPGGAEDGGRWGANADPRCAGGVGSAHHGPARPKGLRTLTTPKDGRTTADAIMPSMHAYAESTRGTLHERVVLIHKGTGEVLADYEQKLELTPDFRHEATKDSGFSNADMFVPGKDAEYWPDGTIVSMHTHPEEQSFSDGDWRVLMRATLGEMRVASAGAEYRLEKTPEHFAMPWTARTPAAVTQVWQTFENEAFDEVINGPHKDAPDFVGRVLDGVSRRLAAHFKVTYTVIPRKVREARSTLREFNGCHEPQGAPDKNNDGKGDGGQFGRKGLCAGPGSGAMRGAWTQSQRAISARRATTGPMRPATKTERKRYAIPPSFINAMVSTDPKSEVRATAVSPTTGKTKGVYSASYTNRQALAKWSRIAGVHRQIPKIVKRVDKDSQTPASPDYQTAMALRLILQTGMRNGAENENGTFGATSLQLRHVHVRGDEVGITFLGKGKVQQTYTITDPVFAKYVTARKKAAGVDGDWMADLASQDEGPLFDHGDEDTLAYMKRVAGKQYKVHDLRTWYGTVYADQLTTKLLADGFAPRTAKEKKAFQRQVAKKVAERLGNTPAVTLKTYIHPFVWKEIE